MAAFLHGDEDAEEKMRETFNPAHIDQMIGQAIQFCWMGLSKEKRNIDELERQIRRIVDRALSNMREAFNQFGRAAETGHNGEPDGDQ